ncbi:hypothetical protein E2C01_037572 [Portunus trituberculatus]|uniref:Uncharacterized protein n=1 Tax=Portunus trituberculatus TaxID=210409 RepID=A0A5B7FEY7_PORTR|nr:hypothetical protein [Portunus trituberculatus]
MLFFATGLWRRHSTSCHGGPSQSQPATEGEICLRHLSGFQEEQEQEEEEQEGGRIVLCGFKILLDMKDEWKEA